MTSAPLAGRVALVTGATMGIGAATAAALMAAGCAVASLARKPPETEDGSVFFPIDLAQPAQVLDVVAQVLARFGRIDILVNNAAMTSHAKPLLEVDEAAWDRVYAVNVKSPLALIKAVGRHMVERGEGGRMVNLSSSSAFRAREIPIAYATSKAALGHLSRIAAAEFGAHDINVNTVVPGPTRTAGVRGMGDGWLDEAVKSGPLENLLHRASEPADVASLILYLCLPESRQITGQTLHVSAGAVI